MAAEVGGDSGSSKKGKKKKGKKHSTRIDMTPMVDLGFLLLTFFVLTTTMSTPKSMPIVLPEKKVDEDVAPTKIAEGKILHIILAGNDKIYLYQGIAADAEQSIDIVETNYGKDGIRKKLYDARKKIDGTYANSKDANPSIFLIKAMDESRYKNLVDMLDEMTIIDQKKYALVDISPEEIELIRTHEGGGAAEPE